MIEVINPYRCLEDAEFIGWHKEHGVLVQGDLNSERWKFRPTQKNPKPAVMSERLIACLEETPGIIRPFDKVAQSVYGNSDEDSIIKLRALIGATKKKLEDPTSISRTFGLGVGLGVEKYDLTPRTISVLYSLWSECQYFVPIKRVTEQVYGVDDHRSRISLVEIHADLCSDYLVDTNLVVDVAGLGDGLYLRVDDKDSLSEFKNANTYEIDKRFEPHLQPEFQKWLARETQFVSIQQNTAADYPIDQWLKDGCNFSDQEERVLLRLCEDPDLIHGSKDLARVAYGQKLPPRWKKKMWDLEGHIKAKIKPDFEIFRHRLLGMSLGVRSLGLPNIEYRTLFALWQAYNNGLSLDTLARKLYKNATEKNLGRARAHVFELKGSMADTNFVVGDVHPVHSESTHYSPVLVPKKLILAA